MAKDILNCFVAVLFIAIFAFAPSTIAEATNPIPLAWSQATVTVTGSATTSDDPSIGLGERRLSAQREAKLDALQKLTEQVQATVTDSGAMVAELIAADESLRGPVDAFVQGARITGSRFLKDGSVEVDMEIELKGLAAILGQSK